MTIGKKIRKPLRRLKIQDQAEMEMRPDFIDDGQELTMLSAINSIVTLAEDSELSTMFFEQADRFMAYLSERQGITKMQAVLLSLFIESSASGNKADFSDIARYLDCNNVQVLLYDITHLRYEDELSSELMLEKIEQYCREEIIVKKGSARIGFV